MMNLAASYTKKAAFIGQVFPIPTCNAFQDVAISAARLEI
jgi:hypothetical protein